MKKIKKIIGTILVLITLGTVTYGVDSIDKCYEYSSNKSIQKALGVTKNTSISCYSWDNLNPIFYITPLEGYSLVLKYKMENTGFLALINQSGEARFFNTLNDNKSYEITLETIYDKNNNPINFNFYIDDLDSGNRVESWNSDVDDSLPIYDIKKLTILGKKGLTNIYDLGVQYHSSNNATGGFVKVDSIDATEWYSSEGNCGETKEECVRNYYYNWSLGNNNNKDNNITSVLLNIYYDFNNDKEINIKEEIVFSAKKNFETPIEFGDNYKIIFDNFLKKFNKENLSNLTFQNGIQLVDDSYIYDLTPHNFYNITFYKE